MRSACKTAAQQVDALASDPDAMFSAGSLKSTLVAKMSCGQIG